ncbi:M56 family metallopeptidase [Luteimonas terrae]|uniref:Peptidase M56 domain-containing protein n=1 Tax=Luteimonas terrae TaxID=1530191 RepID=A0A4V3AP11_9GAMM|nr:M56 family metallopeptidase [Luteimonas terrae]TDK33742.1 hypothetical protein E2F49_07070 [Luteimonas terrae]
MALAHLIEQLLPRLLAASVQSTLLVALVWALCRLLPRMSPDTRCWLWWLVALQLVVGLAWSSPIALPLLPAVEQMTVMPMQVAPLGEAGIAPAQIADDPAQIDAAAPAVWSWTLALALVWLAGVVAMIARSLHGLRASRRLVAAAAPCEDRTLMQALALAADAHGLRKAPEVRVSDAIASPQLIGPWSPVLLLPEGYARTLRADELDMALTHELVHLQRRDLWLGLLPTLAQHLFWFHPLAHYAAREYGLAREGACDAAVLAGHEHGAHAYGALLLRLGIAPRPDAGLASASPDYTFLKRRLTMLQTTRPLSRAIALSTTLLVAVVGVMPYRITNAATPPAPPAPAAPEAPPAPPAPPAAVTPKTPAAPPAPPMPVTPAMPAAPPAPPAPSAPASKSVSRHVTTISSNAITRGPSAADESFVLLDDDHTIAMGSNSDFAEAAASRDGEESMLWIRRGDIRYVVRDSVTSARIRAAFDDIGELGVQQGALGERQGALGTEQGRLGKRQGEIGSRLAELSLRAARDGDDAARNRALEELQSETRSLGTQMGALAREQAALAGEQGELAKLQTQAQARANREARAIVDEVIASGRAQRL